MNAENNIGINLGHLSDQELHELINAAHLVLLSRRHTTGLRLDQLLDLLEEVKLTLSDQGKEWRSLERWQYMDGEIRFWLNPVDQTAYSVGWFSIDDLILWTRDAGSVVKDIEIETDEEEREFLYEQTHD